MRYHIRTQDGDELVVPDGTHLVMLFRQKFLGPEDEIRKEGSQKWRKMGEIPEYASMLRSEKTDVARFKRIFFLTALLACLAIVAAAIINR